MQTKKYTYYEDDNVLIGWLEDYPDYRTMGETMEELEDNLQDIYEELTGGRIPYVRHIGELVLQ